LKKEFEIARLSMVRATREEAIEPARGFAWSRRIYPLNPTPLEEAFADDFRVNRKQVDAVLRGIDEGWRARKPRTFYELEDAFGNQHSAGIDRMDLVFLCRMTFLDRRFDEDLWKALTVAGSGPIESQSLADPFDMEDDINY
jgi:hypothetical protein